MRGQHVYEIYPEKAREYLLNLGVKRAERIGLVGTYVDDSAAGFVDHMFEQDNWNNWKLSGFSAAYASKCAINLAVDFLVKIRTITAHEVSSGTCRAQYEARASGQSGPDSDAFNAESHRELEAAITTLPPRQAEIVRLRFYGELSFVEIGELLGIATDAARKTVKRALPQLRKRLVEGGFVADEALRGFHPPPPQ